jgi:hypothetical protein
MIVPDVRLFYFSSIAPEKQKKLEWLGNTLLRPIHVSSGLGKELRLITFYEARDIEANSMLEIAASIALIIPGFVLGTLVKLAAHATDPEMRKREEEFTPGIPFFFPEMSWLELAHKDTRKVAYTLLPLIANIDKDQAIKRWESAEAKNLIAEFEVCFKRESTALIQAFKNEPQSSWEKIFNGSCKTSPHTLLYPLRFSFLIQVYFIIREGTYYSPNEETQAVESHVRPRFFKEGTVEFRLRKTFNAFLREFEPIAKVTTDERFCTTKRLDEDENGFPLLYGLSSPPCFGLLIDERAVKNAVLAAKK